MGLETHRALVAAGLLAAGIGGLAAVPAGAEQRTITVTLLGGQTITIPVDVPPGTPLDQIVLPTLSTPILSISDSASTITPPQPPAVEPPAASAPAAAPAKKATEQRRKSTTRRRSAATRHKPAATRTAAAPRGSAPPQLANGGVPVMTDPTYSVAIPSFFIDKFRVPPFLLPIYQAAGIQYGVRWEILAAINEIESDYGRNVSTSTAGAVGWMQFMPATWKAYGIDANGDKAKDPYNPVDAIFAAARYLKASGAETDIRKALFAYNHADWYVDSVLMRARLIGGLPADLVGSLTGLTQARFPVAATSEYARGTKATNIFSRAGAAVVAVQDGKIIKTGTSERLGKFVQLRDVYGNTYTYGKLKKVARTYRVAKRRAVAAAAPAASAVTRRAPLRERLQANPTRSTTARQQVKLLRVGSRVPGGTILGRIGDLGDGAAARVRFEIRPAGKDAPRIDPKPILDGWKLLEASALQIKTATPGQVLLMSKAQLQRRVLKNPRIELYAGGGEDVRTGQIDRRVLATLEFLAASGLKPTVSSLKGNHGYLTASGNVSEHASGNAVDISAINGIPIQGHQGSGSVTDIAIRRLLTLQGTTKPHQIISLMRYEGADNTLSLPDHADHIHVGFRPEVQTVLKPLQWTKLIDRLRTIPNPELAG